MGGAPPVAAGLSSLVHRCVCHRDDRPLPPGPHHITLAADHERATAVEPATPAAVPAIHYGMLVHLLVQVVVVVVHIQSPIETGKPQDLPDLCISGSILGFSTGPPVGVAAYRNGPITGCWSDASSRMSPGTRDAGNGPCQGAVSSRTRPGRSPLPDGCGTPPCYAARTAQRSGRYAQTGASCGAAQHPP